MGEMSAALGVGGSFEFEGRPYKLSARNLTTEALFEVFVQENAINAIRRLQPRLGDGEYQMQMDGWRRDVAGFVYTFDGPICLQAMLSSAGARHLVFLQMHQDNPGINQGVVDRIYADATKWTELMQKLGALNNAPNSQGPTSEPAAAKA